MNQRCDKLAKSQEEEKIFNAKNKIKVKSMWEEISKFDCKVNEVIKNLKMDDNWPYLPRRGLLNRVPSSYE